MYSLHYWRSFLPCKSNEIFLVIDRMNIFYSINESFARAKRELCGSNHENELILFMCSTFRRITGMNNRRNVKSKAASIVDVEETSAKAPLATMDDD